jgi:hypothetical protein
MFTRPGQKTRAGGSDSEQQITVPEITAAAKETAIPEIDDIPSPRWTTDTVEAFARCHQLLKRMSEDAANAAWLVHGLGNSIIDAANIMNKLLHVV